MVHAVLYYFDSTFHAYSHYLLCTLAQWMVRCHSGSCYPIFLFPRTIFPREYCSPEQYFHWIRKALYSPSLRTPWPKPGTLTKQWKEDSRGEQYFLGKIVRGNIFPAGTASPLTPVFHIGLSLSPNSEITCRIVSVIWHLNTGRMNVADDSFPVVTFFSWNSRFWFAYSANMLISCIRCCTLSSSSMAAIRWPLYLTGLLQLMGHLEKG